MLCSMHIRSGSTRRGSTRCGSCCACAVSLPRRRRVGHQLAGARRDGDRPTSRDGRGRLAPGVPRCPPVAHSTPGDERRATPGRLRPLVRAPGPSGRVVYSEAIPTPVLSTGAPPGWQGAETPGFARAAAGAVELPFSRREAIVRRFGTEDALLETEVALRAGDADELGWSATRRREVLADIHRLNAIVQLDPPPPRRWSTSTGARLRRWDSFSMPSLIHRDAAEGPSMGELPAR